MARSMTWLVVVLAVAPACVVIRRAPGSTPAPTPAWDPGSTEWALVTCPPGRELECALAIDALNGGGLVIKPVDPDQPLSTLADILMFRRLHVVAARAPGRLYESLQHAVAPGGDILTVEREQLSVLQRLGPSLPDTAESAWGVAATGADVAASHGVTGAGIKVAILDSGLACGHPDFPTPLDARVVARMDFVPAEMQPAPMTPGVVAEDVVGHGTHVAGVIVGRRPGAVTTATAPAPRYGVAPGATLFIGRVFDRYGVAYDRWILHGIEWALANECHIVNLSLGRTAAPSEAFNTVGRSARAEGTIVIAAAGNGGQFAGDGRRVLRPANSRSIVAVGAVDRTLTAASFSAWGVDYATGGGVDFVAPGVSIFTSTPPLGAGSGAILYERDDGTSLACPFVAGLFALHMEKVSSTTPRAERAQMALDKLERAADRGVVDGPFLKIGRGLAKAP
jgi:subtilisin